MTHLAKAIKNTKLDLQNTLYRAKTNVDDLALLGIYLRTAADQYQELVKLVKAEEKEQK